VECASILIDRERTLMNSQSQLIRRQGIKPPVVNTVKVTSKWRPGRKRGVLADACGRVHRKHQGCSPLFAAATESLTAYSEDKDLGSTSKTNWQGSRLNASRTSPEAPWEQRASTVGICLSC